MKIEHKFVIKLDDGETPLWRKVELWSFKQGPGIRQIILTWVVPWLKQRWIKVKVENTMRDIDTQAADIVEVWEKEEAEKSAPLLTVEPVKENETDEAKKLLGFDNMRITNPVFSDPFN